MKTAIAISPMMRNVLSVAKIPPAAVKASQMARIAPRIIPMIRPMYPVCARRLRQATVVPDAPVRGWGLAGRLACLAGTALVTSLQHWARDDRRPLRCSDTSRSQSEREPPFGATPRPDGLTADGAQNRMLRASEMAVRQRSQMPLMVRQNLLVRGISVPGIGRSAFLGEVISEGGCGACSGSALQSIP